MGRGGRVGRSRGKGLTASQAKRKWRKDKEKLNKRIECEPIRDAWDSKRSMKANCRLMGLAVDPNTIIPLKKNIQDLDADEEQIEAEETNTIRALRSDARPSEIPVFVSLEERKFYDYLLSRYGENYEKMVRDSRNVDQRTAKQLKRQIARYRLWLERKQAMNEEQ